jgi:general secretion pathway protein I
MKRYHAHRLLPGCEQSGFTLLEMMVAVSMIAIVFVSVFKMHTQTLAMSTAARFYTTAPMLAEKKLTEITQAEDEVSDDTGDFGEKFPGYRWQVAINDVESEILGETVTGLKQIDLRIFMENEPSVHSLTTYRLYIEE